MTPRLGPVQFLVKGRHSARGASGRIMMARASGEGRGEEMRGERNREAFGDLLTAKTSADLIKVICVSGAFLRETQ